MVDKEIAIPKKGSSRLVVQIIFQAIMGVVFLVGLIVDIPMMSMGGIIGFFLVTVMSIVNIK